MSPLTYQQRRGQIETYFDRTAVQTLREDMTKVQSLLVVVDERLQQLEESQVDSENDEDSRSP